MGYFPTPALYNNIPHFGGYKYTKLNKSETEDIKPAREDNLTQQKNSLQNKQNATIENPALFIENTR